MSNFDNNIKCIFCSLQETLTATEFLHNDNLAFAINDISPVAPAHALIIPKNHDTRIGQPGSEATVTRLVSIAGNLAKTLQIDMTGYRLTINKGPDTGQQVDHLHMHLIGGKAVGPIG